MPIETIRFFSAINLTNASGDQAIQPGDTNGNLDGQPGPFFVGNDTGALFGIDDQDTGAGGDTAANFDDGTGADQFLNEDVTLTYDDGSGVVTTTFPAGTQIQAEFTVSFSSGFSIVGLRLTNPDAPPPLITAGYTIFDADGNPTVPPPGTNLGNITSTTNNGTTPYINIVCFTEGCRIETPTGARLVQDLSIGDQVLTLDHGAQLIRWMGGRSLDASTLADHPNLRPIRIGAGALGDGMPRADLVVSPQHRILLRSRIATRMFDTDEVFVAAKHLVGMPGITVARDVARVRYVHFMCDAHEIVWAEGALAETLYTGGEAMKAMTPAARREIHTVLGDAPDQYRPLARPTPKRTRARQLIARHTKNAKALFSHQL